MNTNAAAITSVLPLVGVGRAVDGADVAYGTDEPTVFGDEGDGDAAVIRLCVHLDIGIAAGGEEAVDAGADGGDVQGLADFQGKNFVEFCGFEGLSLGTELDVGDLEGCVFLVLSEEGGRERGNGIGCSKRGG
jgi:hypothetical protein